MSLTEINRELDTKTWDMYVVNQIPKHENMPAQW
jgi:hypothetical protein